MATKHVKRPPTSLASGKRNHNHQTLSSLGRAVTRKTDGKPCGQGCAETGPLTPCPCECDTAHPFRKTGYHFLKWPSDPRGRYACVPSAHGRSLPPSSPTSRPVLPLRSVWNVLHPVIHRSPPSQFCSDPTYVDDRA